MPEEIETLRMESSMKPTDPSIDPTIDHSIQTSPTFFPLSSAQKTEPSLQPSARPLFSANPYTPTSALAQAAMVASRTLSEIVIVHEWLHDTASPPPRPDASTGYWRFTKHCVTQGRWTGNTGPAAEDVVREMNPDAVVRVEEIGRILSGGDVIYDKASPYTLFAFVCAVDIEGAVKLRCSLAPARQYDAAEEGEEGDPNFCQWDGTYDPHYGRQLASTPLSIPACRLQNVLYTPCSRRPPRPQLLSHVGRRALGNDFCFMRRATEQGTCPVGWGILGAI